MNLNASFPYATTVQDMAPCLVTTCNMFYLTRYNRFLTERECLRLQGFPDDYEQISSRNKNFKQIGNSMSINVLCFLLLEIYRSIV
jgi:site-specific DNA-cytosine methylase